MTSRLASTVIAALLGAAGLHAQYVVTPLQAADANVDDQFGVDVDVRAGRVIIGATFAEFEQSFPFGDVPAAGTAYVYRKVAGSWVLEGQLWSNDLEALGLLGRGVALGTDRAAVGAPGKDAPLSTTAGEIEVFRFTHDMWIPEAELKTSPVAVGAQLGWSVAMDGTTVVGGGPYFDQPFGTTGALWVFRLVPGQGWKQIAMLINASMTHAQRLGMSVALSGDTLLGGAHLWGCNGPPGTCTGGVFVFREVGGTWIEEATLAPADGATGDQFGIGVDLDGDVAVVGSHHDDDLGPDSGSAYVFRRTGSAWAQEAKLLPCDGSAGANFGRSVALSGNTIVVGAALDPEGAGGGASYVFRRENGAWEQVAKVPLPALAGAEAGAAVGVDGAVAAVGAPLDDLADNDTGSVWLLEDASVHPTWSNFSGGLAGSSGVPTLQGSGTLVGGTPLTLTLAGAAPLAPSTLVIGLVTLCVPFKGGLLVPAPDVLIPGLVTDAGGGWALGSTWPPGVPSGLDILMQTWIADPAGPQGFAASAALEAHAP